ncbi:retroviral-like aspartic protease [Candidatus Roizmanbacteria bacterium]|nr:retroviral-like aspartic protease [Candidatus Roizmanbacteria bacterium]
MAKYPYYIPSSGVYKPWIKVHLGYKKSHKITSIPIVALIDSGADVCFCSEDIGIWLGISLNKRSQYTFTTANKTKFTAIKETITLYVCNQQYQCPFYFSGTLPLETPIILGQLGFFDHFKIIFNLQYREFEVV